MWKEHLGFDGGVTGGCWHQLMCGYYKRQTHLFKNIPNPLKATSILTSKLSFSQRASVPH